MARTYEVDVPHISYIAVDSWEVMIGIPNGSMREMEGRMKEETLKTVNGGVAKLDDIGAIMVINSPCQSRSCEEHQRYD